MRTIILNKSILLLALFICACQGETNQQTGIQLVESDSVLCLENPTTLNPTTHNLRFFKQDSIEYLFFENGQKRSISLFDITNRQYLKDIKPQREGPNGIGSKMFGFDIVNFDTIFITTSGLDNMLFVIDSSSALKKKIEFVISHKPYLPLTNLWSCFGYDVAYENGNMYISSLWEAPDDLWNQSYDYSIGYCFDFETDEASAIPLCHPDFSGEKDLILNSDKNFIKNGDTFVMSYKKGHQVFVSKNYAEWQSFNLKSRYINGNFRNSIGTDFLTSIKNYVESPHYCALVYDKYRHVYYRFVYPGVIVEDDVDVRKLEEFLRIFSVMVIDEDFNILGETLMPENTYNSNMFFINEAGLWISTNHPDNPDFDEDLIKFQLFTLK